MKILFICTHNRCRSILAEAIANKVAKANIQAKSAGSAPAGTVHPLTLENLQRRDYEIKGLRSQSWNDLADFTADVTLTVCDNAANEVCPVSLDDSIQVHWGLKDPTAQPSDKQQSCFDTVIDLLEKRMLALNELDFNGLSKQELKKQLQLIGEIN